jgi:hypothetical protein
MLLLREGSPDEVRNNGPPPILWLFGAPSPGWIRPVIATRWCLFVLGDWRLGWGREGCIGG